MNLSRNLALIVSPGPRVQNGFVISPLDAAAERLAHPVDETRCQHRVTQQLAVWLRDRGPSTVEELGRVALQAHGGQA